MGATYAFLDCEEARKWLGHEKFFFSAYGSESEWDVFRCHKGELPELKNAGQYAAIFISGSHHSAYEEQPWILELAGWIRKFAYDKGCTTTKLVGICFGHQILARALGGDVQPNPSSTFALIVETVQLLPALRRKAYFKQALAQAGLDSAAPPESLLLLESHGDQVTRVPEGACTLATSPTARAEVWEYQDRVLGIQGHPEFSCFDALERIHPYIVRSGRFNAEQAEESRESLLHTAPDNNLVNALIRAFVAHELPAGRAAPAPAAAVHEAWEAGEHGQHVSSPPTQQDRASQPAAEMQENQPHEAGACSDRSAGAVSHHSNGDTSATALQELNGRDAQTDAAALAEQAHLQGLTLAPSAELPVSTPPLHFGAHKGATACSRLDVEDALSTATSDLTAASPGQLEPTSDLQDTLVRARAARSLHAEVLQHKVQELSQSLATLAGTQFEVQAAHWQHLQRLNELASEEYAGIASRLQDWTPLIEEAQRKHAQLQPLWKSIELLSQQMDVLETTVTDLSKASIKLAKKLGV